MVHATLWSYCRFTKRCYCKQLISFNVLQQLAFQDQCQLKGQFTKFPNNFFFQLDALILVVIMFGKKSLGLKVELFFSELHRNVMLTSSCIQDYRFPRKLKPDQNCHEYGSAL